MDIQSLSRPKTPKAQEMRLKWQKKAERDQPMFGWHSVKQAGCTAYRSDVLKEHVTTCRQTDAAYGNSMQVQNIYTNSHHTAKNSAIQHNLTTPIFYQSFTMLEWSSWQSCAARSLAKTHCLILSSQTWSSSRMDADAFSEIRNLC